MLPPPPPPPQKQQFSAPILQKKISQKPIPKKNKVLQNNAAIVIMFLGYLCMWAWRRAALECGRESQSTKIRQKYVTRAAENQTK